jgi:hypothetical protein
MKNIVAYHGSEQTISKPTPQQPLYLTNNVEYGHIKKSSYIHQVNFQPTTPYWTDNISFVEGLRHRPEHLLTLQGLGYDAVVYADRHNLSKGASGWGNDTAQYVVLDHACLQHWKPLQERPLHTQYFDSTPSEYLIKGVFHATNSYFLNFNDTGDIGYHFGTQSAAQDRFNSLRDDTSAEIVERGPSHIDHQRSNHHHHPYHGGPAGMAYSLLLRKIQHPKPELQQTLTQMSEAELADVIEEFAQQPDHPSYLASIQRAEQGRMYDVNIGGQLIFSSPQRNVAEYVAKAGEAHLFKKVDLIIRNPFEIDDLGTWGAESILRSLPNNAAFSDEFHRQHNREAQFNIVKLALGALGHDALIYENKVEDPGSMSYIALGNEQIIPYAPALPRETIDIHPDTRPVFRV